MILLPLLDAQMPANTGGFFNQIMGIAAFDLFDIKDYIDIVLDLKPTDPVSAKLETLGFESLYFLHNLGTFTCVIIGYTLVVILWFLLYPFAKLSFWIK